MKISSNWLSEFISLNNKTIEQELTQLGLEVDTISKNKNDYIIDIEFTPNRGDCLSAYGISRDLAAFKNKKIKLPQASTFSHQRNNNYIRKVAPDICPEYRFMPLCDVELRAKSPKFITDKLIKSDITPVNIIVDISNYVMMEVGQPTHAFDIDKINGKLSIIKSKKDLTFIGINNKQYNINKGTPVIVDDDDVIHALPGVIGSKESMVDNDTKNILFESAFFLPNTVRSLSTKYRIQTDSSYRFERGVDYKLQEFALSRIHLILSSYISIGKCDLNKISYKSPLTKTNSFKFDYKLFKRILGIELQSNKVKAILSNLGFIFKSDKVIVPSFRFDVTSNYDLVEEVSRIIGYNNIPESPLSTKISLTNKRYTFQDRLITLGYKEAINFTFIAKNYSHNNTQLELKNPISKDKSVMRDSLIPGLLKNIQYNHNRKHKSIQLYETGKIYIKPKSKIFEINTITGVLFGLRSSSDLVSNQYNFGIDDLKSHILSVIPNSTFDINSGSTYFDDVNSFKILQNNKAIGECGLIRSTCAQDFDIKGAVLAFEINEDLISESNKVTFNDISQYPAVYKDITLITNIDDSLSTVIKEMNNNGYKYMKSIRIKDIFISKDKLQLNNRNVTLEICLQSMDRTLNDEDINKSIQSITNDIKKLYKLNIQEA